MKDFLYTVINPYKEENYMDRINNLSNCLKKQNSSDVSHKIK